MTTHEVLVAARNLIDRRGWIQHELRDSGGFCARGGVMEPCRASDGRHIRPDTVEAIRGAEMTLAGLIPESEATGDAGPPGRLSSVVDDEWMEAMAKVIRFNNAEGRTKAEVLAAFDRAIALTAPAPADPFVGGLGPVVEAVASLNLEVS